jgi:DNA repair protein RadC
MQQLCFFEKTEGRFWKDLKSGKFAKMVIKESKGQYLKGSTEAFHVMKPIFAEVDDIERMFCIFMDQKNNIKSIDKVSEGSLNSASIYPRELIKKAIKCKAASVVISHNHPSGDPAPSREDRALTLKLVFSFKAVDINLLDHIVVGNRSYYSFADDGIMAELNQKFQEVTSLF